MCTCVHVHARACTRVHIVIEHVDVYDGIHTDCSHARARTSPTHKSSSCGVAWILLQLHAVSRSTMQYQHSLALLRATAATCVNGRPRACVAQCEWGIRLFWRVCPNKKRNKRKKNKMSSDISEARVEKARIIIRWYYSACSTLTLGNVMVGFSITFLDQKLMNFLDHILSKSVSNSRKNATTNNNQILLCFFWTYTQWAAVIICILSITVPPQPVDKRHIHGHELGTASVPPTMRVSEISGWITGLPHCAGITHTSANYWCEKLNRNIHKYLYQ